MKSIEQWQPVKGYEEFYAVSNLGRVKSLKYGKERILKQANDGDGYLTLGLYRNGKRKAFKVYKLVASAFIPNPMGLPEINHKDENPSNNVVSNIEWCSRRYNVNYGSRTKNASAALTNRQDMSKPVEASKYEDFREICLRFASIMEAGRNGYNQGHVSDCCRKCFHREGNNRYKNLYWRYTS